MNEWKKEWNWIRSGKKYEWVKKKIVTNLYVHCYDDSNNNDNNDDDPGNKMSS